MIQFLRTARTLSLQSALIVFLGAIASCQESVSYRQAHAHNDYLHERPLLDALENGFGSVEADIYLVDGKLLVAHTQSDLSADRTLRSLYLDPLRDRIKTHSGKVHSDSPSFTLLIDIKSDGKSTYLALNTLLSEYRDVFSYVEEGKVHSGAVTAIVSGNRAIDTIASDTIRYVGIDGRLTDLESDLPNHLLPLISDNWTSHFKWRGTGELPSSDRDKLNSIIESVHQKQRRIRFWATPDNATVWAALKEAGVDLINTDDLKGLSEFLRSSENNKASDLFNPRSGVQTK